MKTRTALPTDRRDLDASSILERCEAGAIPANTSVQAAIEAHRIAFARHLRTADNEAFRTVAMYALHAIVLARTPKSADYRTQIEYLSALPIAAWDAIEDSREALRDETLAMIARNLTFAREA